jgi:hypothetical protein
MKPWHFAAVGLALLTTLGCRTDPAIPILEHELRLKEDEVYRLRGQIEDMQACAVDNRPRANASKRDDTAGRSENGGKASADEPASRPRINIEGLSNPTPTPPSSITSPPGGTRKSLPEPWRGTPAPSNESLPNSNKSSGLRQPSEDSGRFAASADSLDGPALDGPPRRSATRGVRGQLASTQRDVPGARAAGDNRRIKSIALDPMLTGGLNDDDGRDKGLLVVIEPRDGENRVIDAPAEVSVAVLDPAVLDREGYATRVARWDFTAGEIAQMFCRTSAGPAIHIEAAWPDGPPAHGKLHVFVRYTTADGRKLEANQPIEVAAGEKSTRQKHASAGAPDAATATLSRRSAWAPDRR